jgi:hypothetical protein
MYAVILLVGAPFSGTDGAASNSLPIEKGGWEGGREDC